MLFEMLCRTGRRMPDAPALSSDGQTFTFSELIERVTRLAGGLGSLGIGIGDRVGLAIPNTHHFVEAFFSVAALHATVVPLAPSLAHQEILSHLKGVSAKAVIIDPSIVDPTGLQRSGVSVIATTRESGDWLRYENLLQSPAFPGEAPVEDATAVIQFSSGSTGRPKQTPRTHANCRAEADAFTATAGLTPEDIVFCPVPLHHAYGLGDGLLAAIRSGAHLILFAPRGPFVLHRARVLELLERHRVTVFPAVPLIFHQIAEAPGSADLTHLRLCISAGSALRRQDYDRIRARYGVQVRQQYGCTEAGAVTVNMDPDTDETSDSVGTPLRDVQLKVLQGEDGIGEIAFTSPALTAGYIEKEANAAAFHEGWFHTGDFGTLDDQGRLYLRGRKAFLVHTAGQKVDATEVEEVLMRHPAVEEAVVVGIPGAWEGEERIKAIVTRRASVTDRQLKDHCAHHLASYKRPEIITFVTEIPRSATGKILRDQLIRHEG